MNNKTLRKRLIALMLLMSLFICGFGSGAVELDTAKYRIYRNVMASDLSKRYSVDADSAMNKYRYSAVAGYVVAVSSDGKQFKVSTNQGNTSDVILCESKNGYSLGINDPVVVYGEMTTKLFTKQLVLKVDSCASYDGNFKGSYSWSTLNDTKTLGKADMTTISLGDGEVTYKVPSSWISVQDELENANGYGYVLSDLSDGRSGRAELFFAFYFGSDSLNINDKVDTSTVTKKVQEFFIKNAERIENGIINNILGTTNASRSFKKKDTGFGVTYSYFDATYSNPVIGNSYNVEFVFKPVGDIDGFMVYMYVFTEGSRKHFDDVMFVLRLSEEKW